MNNSSTTAELRIVQVRCYSGYTYAQEPRSFIWQGEENRIKTIDKAWQEPGSKLFKVTTEEGKSYNLCYNLIADKWTAIEVIA